MFEKNWSILVHVGPAQKSTIMKNSYKRIVSILMNSLRMLDIRFM